MPALERINLIRLTTILLSRRLNICPKCPLWLHTKLIILLKCRQSAQCVSKCFHSADLWTALRSRCMGISHLAANTKSLLIVSTSTHGNAIWVVFAFPAAKAAERWRQYGGRSVHRTLRVGVEGCALDFLLAGFTQGLNY